MLAGGDQQQLRRSSHRNRLGGYALLGQVGYQLGSGVIDFQRQRHFPAERPTAAQPEQGITAQAIAIGFVVVAAADRLPARTDAELIELPIQVQVPPVGAPRTAGEGVAAVAVARVDQRNAQVALPAEQLVLERGFKTIDTVCAPALGGLFAGYELARALDKRFIFAERVNGEMVIRRGFEIKEGEKILICEDIITTANSRI